MRTAVIADIHGNLAALDAVLADIETQDVDQVLNLGDICSGGLFPRETAERLIPLGFPTIRGNHERQVLTKARSAMSLSDGRAADSLEANHLDWFRSLPQTRRCGDLLMVHGTPTSDLEYFLETVTPDGIRPATVDEVVRRAGLADAPVIVCGHTHIARSVALPDGRLIVNPGSVGLQAYDDDLPYPHIIENASPHARYAILDDASGAWSVAFRLVAYDWDTAARQAELNGRPDWVRALGTGRF